MAVVNLDVFPEIVVAFAFCPIGFTLTFILHYAPIGLTVGVPSFYDLIWGPYLVIMACAIISCGIMLTVKLMNDKYRFEHMYLILVGLVTALIAGIAMFLYEQYTESRLLVYITAPSIGFIYVPGLAYIHARSKDYRHIKISLCHIFGFIGFILGTVVLTQYERKERYQMLKVYGYILTAITIVAILLIAINEILQFRYKTYFNYKQSAEYNMDYENKFKTIFLKSYFKNVSQNVDINLNNYKPNVFKLAGYMIYLVVIKLIGLTFFYYPLIFINWSIISQNDLFYCYLVSIIGLVASTILLQFITIKINLVISLIVKIISFLILILFVNIYEMNDDELKIFYWIHSMCLLYGCNVNDILVLELSKLKYTEVVLTIGLVLEISINGALHFFVLTSPGTIYNLKETVPRLLLEHIIPIVIVLLIILFITILVLPETGKKTVLEIQNVMFVKTHDKKSNGSGTSIQQKEQSKEYDSEPPSNGFVKNRHIDDGDRMHPSSRFRHVQNVSMTSSTATSEFNYRNSNFENDPYPQTPVVVQRPPTPEPPSFDYNQIKPRPIFPRPRPTSSGFDPFNRF